MLSFDNEIILSKKLLDKDVSGCQFIKFEDTKKKQNLLKK